MTQRPSADRYVVEGRGEFPSDMMRRDRSRPASDEDRAKVEATREGGLSGRDTRRITLETRERETLDERWLSFGWRVVRPLRPWNQHSGYTGPEPTEDLPPPDTRRMVTMCVLCPDDATAMKVESAMRQAAALDPAVAVEPSCIESLAAYRSKIAHERSC